MAAKKSKFRGRIVECWEKSCRISNKNDQPYYASPVIHIGNPIDERILAQLCDFADAAYAAGEESVRQNLKALLRIS